MTHQPMAFSPYAPSRPGLVTIDQAFDDEELARIELACEYLSLEHIVAGPEGEIFHNRRDVRVAMLANGAETGWIFLKLMKHLHAANMQLRMELWGISECAQYSVYEQGRFCWHVDNALENGALAPPRKLSFELQLSRSSEYEGGARELLGAAGKSSARYERGTLVVFPSFVLTRVRSVTRGRRRSLDGWVSGPELR